MSDYVYNYGALPVTDVRHVMREIERERKVQRLLADYRRQCCLRMNEQNQKRRQRRAEK